MKNKYLLACYISVSLFAWLTGCDNRQTLFRQVPAEASGIDFNNRVDETDSINPLDLEFLYNGGGVGVAASLFTAGTINDAHVTILLPAIFLMGAQLQFMGRCLGTIGVQSGLYAAYFSISVINAMGAMLLTRLILSFY